MIYNNKNFLTFLAAAEFWTFGLGFRGQLPSAQAGVNEEEASYFFAELLKSCEASYLEKTPTESLIRAGLLSCRTQRLRASLERERIRVRCYHQSVEHPLPIDSADEGLSF